MSRGYSLDGLANVIYPSFQDVLSADLNTLDGRDGEGKYLQALSAGATPEKHYPIAEAGVLEVLRHGGNRGDNVMQRYTSFSSRRMFIRTQADSAGAWTSWDEYARMSEIYKQVYPVGAIYTCVNSINPNTLFPGTTWSQITDGRVLRTATNNTVGTGDGNIGQTGGSETYTISAAMMPVHSHTIAHTHDAPQHTHSVPAHSHTMAHTHGVAAHTHSVPAHSHTMAHTHSTPNHTHSGTANSAGDHSHDLQMTGSADGTGTPPYPADGRPSLESTNTAGQAGGVRNAGAHTHTVTIPSSGGGTTGGSSAANTGTQAAMTTGGTALTTGGSSAASTGNSTAFNTGNATALTTGGPSVASTGNAGGTTSMTVTNMFRRVAVWQRTA